MQKFTTLLLALVVVSAACREKAPDVVPPAGPAPDSFRVAFQTSKGQFTVQVNRAWSPNGADRFRDLVYVQFFDENRFFRVLPEFIAQFGINDDKKVNEKWDVMRIPDDALVAKNLRGTLTFATDGKDSRSHQLFFNLKDNTSLDKQGFTPIGRVVDGMNVVDSIYSGYGERPSGHMISTLGNSYLRRMFPKLDFIQTARILTP
ncbi:MAG: peptidylprolyl isomerase [Gemmatimonadota bacterium]